MNNILIVDDKSENLYLFELMLKEGGFTTVSARNGAEALVLARQALPDLIISDILMPIMDGFTLCRELKKDRKLKNIPFIFYTATYTDPKDEEFALSLGADRFLLKPLDIPEFIAIVKTVLKEAKKKNIRKIEPPSSPEEVILKEYNEALVRKLEDKMVQIEHAEKEVRKYNIALLREIEERKQYAEALRESEIKYRAFFENSMDSILLTSPDGRIFSANPAACSMFGYSEEELIKLGKSAVVDTTDPRLSVLIAEGALTGKAHGELTFVRKDGTHFPAEISSSVFNDHEGLENTSMIIRDITEQKKAEQKIRESEKRFRAIFDQAPIAIALLDMQGYPIISNSPLSKLVGYSNDELSKMKFTDFTHTDDIDKDMNQFSDLIDGKITRYTMEKRYFHKNGNIVWANLFVTMLRDENGMPREIIGMAEDITERKHAEEILRESEAKLDEATKIAKLGTWEYDVDREQFTFNDQFYSLLHTTAEREGGYTMSPTHYANKFLHPDDSAMVGVETQKALETTDPNYYSHLDHRIICADGEIGYISVNIKIVKDIHGRTVKTYGVNQVITERKRAEEALTYERNLLKALMDNTTDHIYIKDSENRFIRISKAHANIFGLSDPAEAIGKTDFDFFTDEHARPAYDAELEIMKTGKPVVDLEEKETWPDGRVTWVSTTKVPLRDINGKVFGTFGVSRDITERKHILEELMIAKEKAEQSDKLKTAFLAQMSHEIRTPLNAIVGNTSFLNDLFGDKMNAEAHDCFDSINLASERMIRTVDLTLNAAELQISGYKPNFVKVDLNNAILYKLYLEYQLSARQKGLKFDYTCKENETVVSVDEYSVTQIFSNLIDNAIKYTNKGKVEIHLGKNIKGNIFVEVRDTGIGMNESFLPTMFDPFVQEDQGYSRSYEGNGLGLTLVKKYCDLNHATIEVESRKNVGSAFKVIFTNDFSEVTT